MILNGRKKETFTGKKIDIKKQNRKRFEYIGKVVLLSALLTLQGGMPIVHAAEIPNNIQITEDGRYQYQDLYEVKGDITIYDEDGKAITIEDGEVVLGKDETYEKNDKEYRQVLYENEEGEHYASIEEETLEKSNLFETLKFKAKEAVENLTKPIKNTIENLFPNSEEEKEDKNGESERTVDITKTIEEDIKNRRYVSVPREQGKYLHMREEPLYNSKIVDNIPNGSRITIFSNEDPIMDGNLRYIKIQYGDKIGYVSDAYLYTIQEFRKLYPEKIVEIPKGEGDTLHMREEPSFESKKIGNIPEGETVHLLSEEKTQDGRLQYVKVEYNGQVGYVAEQYLKDKEYLQEKNANTQEESTITQEKSEITKEGIKLNNGGSITFTDTNNSSVEDVKQLIEFGTRIEENAENAIPKDIRGDVQVLGFKLSGAQTTGETLKRFDYAKDYYQNGNFDKRDLLKDEYGNDLYPYLYGVQVESIVECEKNNQPYILYYFNQGTNESEGREEGQYMVENLDNIREILRKQGLDMNNCLFYAVDIETGEYAYRNDVKAQNATIEGMTSSVIATLKELKKAGYPAVIYTDSRHIAGYGAEPEIDLEKIIQETDDCQIWLTAWQGRESSPTRVMDIQEMIEKINEKYGTNASYLGTQTVINNLDRTKYDYSEMSIEMYEELYQKMLNREGILENNNAEQKSVENAHDDDER